jgi:unsaturated rhamnogalacturonyl hydrolase
MKKMLAVFLLGATLSTTIADTARLVADWQLTQAAEMPVPDTDETGWIRAAFYIGLARWAEHSNDKRYFDLIRDLGNRNKWQLGPQTYLADDQAIGQVYAAAYDRYGDPTMIEPMIARFDFILAHKPLVSLNWDDNRKCAERWCWSDALFMAPASWFAAARQKKDSRYRDFADAEFWAAKDYLFDPDEHLFFRDSRFFNQRGSHGEKIFWGRGNAWVFAALANILRELPADDSGRHRYEALLVEMAKKLLTLQRSDGFWTTSLMSPLETGTSESSCTAFVTYGLATGINMKLLDRQQVAPSALRGWGALMGTMEDGRLGRVQGPGDRPARVGISDTQFYGSGALLLAASALDDMQRSSR